MRTVDRDGEMPDQTRCKHFGEEPANPHRASGGQGQRQGPQEGQALSHVPEGSGQGYQSTP